MFKSHAQIFVVWQWRYFNEQVQQSIATERRNTSTTCRSLASVGRRSLDTTIIKPPSIKVRPNDDIPGDGIKKEAYTKPIKHVSFNKGHEIFDSSIASIGIVNNSVADSDNSSEEGRRIKS